MLSQHGLRSQAVVCPAPRMQAPTAHTFGEAAQALLSLLACIDEEEDPVAATLTALASGMFSQLAVWAIRATRRPTNLLVRWQALGQSGAGLWHVQKPLHVSTWRTMPVLAIVLLMAMWERCKLMS